MNRGYAGFAPSPNAPSARGDVIERLPGEFVPDAPWDFPPGTPGWDTEKPSQEFLDWLRAHDPQMVVGWQPVTRAFVIWRRGRDGSYKCVMPCANPFDFQWGDLEPGQPMPVLDNRIKALLIDSNPDTYGGEKQMLKYAQDRLSQKEEAKRDHTLEVMRQARDQSKQMFRPMVGAGNAITGKRVHKAYK